MRRLTREQAWVIGAYTGYALGPFADIHAYIEQKLGHPVMTSELGSERMHALIREATKDDFLRVCYGKQ